MAGTSGHSMLFPENRPLPSSGESCSSAGIFTHRVALPASFAFSTLSLFPSCNHCGPRGEKERRPVLWAPAARQPPAFCSAVIRPGNPAPPGGRVRRGPGPLPAPATPLQPPCDGMTPSAFSGVLSPVSWQPLFSFPRSDPSLLPCFLKSEF